MHSTSSRISRRVVGVVAASAAVTLALAACAAPADQDDSAPSKDTLTISVPTALGSFSPQVIGDGYAVQWMQAAYDSLTFAEDDGTYSPMLAESWEYDDTNTVLTLELVDGVTFADGTAFDASVVKANLEATRDGAGGSATALASIEDVVVVDDSTVELDLVAPDPSLIRSLSQVPGMMANPNKIGDPSLDSVPDGTGPYELDTANSVVGSSFVFTKKDDYWNTDLSLPFTTITLQSITDPSAVLSALLSGQLDSAFVPTSIVQEAESSGLTISPYSAPGVIGLYLWDRAGAIVPALGDVRVRQAINYAIDKDALLDNVRLGYGQTTGQLFRPDWASSDEAFDDAYPYDPEKAVELLAEAGYPDGFTVDMYQSAAIPELDLVAQYLSEVGITVNWIPSTNIGVDIQSGGTGMSVFQLASQAPWQIVTFYLLPGSPWNVLESQSDDLDELIDAARFAESDEDRDAALHDVNEYLVDEAWFAPFYFLQGNYASTNGVTVNAPYVNVPAIYDFQLAD